MIRLIIILLVITGVFSSTKLDVYGESKNTKQKMQTIIITQKNRYPLMEVRDLYKLLHQAAFGSEHAVKDTAFVRKWLEEEWAKIDSTANETICDTINPNGQIVRMNLRPCKFYGFDKEKILRGFIKTANSYQGSKKNFEQFWKWAEELAGKLHFSKKEMAAYFKEMKKLGYPAVHHSKKYQSEYKPAYRVLMKDEIPAK